MKVLIVDDSLLAEAAIKSYFVKLGHDVVGLAKNGEIAKNLIEEHNPDLITVDAVMPGMSGQDLIKYINSRDEETGNNTKILMISSDTIPTEEKQEMKVNSYIIKPITMSKIQDALKQF
ncbi:MAG: response regulator [Candidatus Heimdallarchaeota archaeon]|nr:response regulator [Candidatus Heimdallarchaeota archaeon]